MITKRQIVIFIILTISWIIVYYLIKGRTAKTVKKPTTNTTFLTSDTTTASNVAEVKRYYITNSTDTIPSGQAWVRVRNCNDAVGKIDFGGGFSELEAAGTNGDTYYHDFSKQGKVSPQIKLDAVGTKFLVEFSK
jgi:hypothetical protein